MVNVSPILYSPLNGETVPKESGNERQRFPEGGKSCRRSRGKLRMQIQGDEERMVLELEVRLDALAGGECAHGIMFAIDHGRNR